MELLYWIYYSEKYKISSCAKTLKRAAHKTDVSQLSPKPDRVLDDDDNDDDEKSSRVRRFFPTGQLKRY